MATLDRNILHGRNVHRFCIAIVFLIIQLPVAPLVASLIDQLFSFLFTFDNRYKALHFNYSYDVAIRGIFQRTGICLWFLIIEVLVIAFIVWVWLDPHATISRTREIKVTDKISIPVAVGNGQHGNARFTTQNEKKKLFSEFYFNGSNTPVGKGGLVVGMDTETKGDRIQYVGKDVHSIIIGTTGAGKTRRILLETVCLQLLAGNCIVVSDVKGEIFYYTHKFAESKGYQSVVIDLCNPAKSMHYNYLEPIIASIEEGQKAWGAKLEALEIQLNIATQELNHIKDSIIDLEDTSDRQMKEYTDCRKNVKQIENDIQALKKDYSWTKEAQSRVWDLVSVLVKEQKGEPLWYNGETATLAACILVICIEAPTEYRNLYNVYLFLAYMGRVDEETGISPLSAYLETLDDQHPAKFVFMQSQAAAERTRSSFYTSVLGDLRLFTDPAIAEMTSISDFNLSDVGTKKIALYLIVPDEKKTYYPLAAALINQLYIAQVAEARKQGGSLPIATDYDLDEIGNFPAIPVLGGMLSAGRSRKIRANLVVQDYQQLESKYKEEVQTIKTCCAVKAYLKSDNLKTLEELSKNLGKYTVEVTGASTSANTATRSSGSSISNSSNMAARELLMPAEIGQISYPYALVLVSGELPSITRLPDLSEYRFNDMLGMGDEEHNRQLLEEREAERPEHEVFYPPQWGMWIEFKRKLEQEAMNNLNRAGVGLGFTNL
ncbi:MAG: type IV secretory system conjugative DNA transfer family protein [Enterocloster asparagiformis]|nr:type IV secretory system conjugative DNA transfer family protein [Enterocloster asparagiformis]